MADREEDARFERASKFLEHNRRLFNQEQLLQFYGLYKQATFGPCNIPKPGILDLAGRAKWCAWSKLKDLDQTVAKREYIALMQARMPEGERLDDSEPEPGWVSVSRLKRVEELDDAACESANPLVSRIKDEDVDEVRSVLERNGTAVALHINQPDADGLAAIHWAADRGNVDILSLVLTVPGININLRDADGQTALHYASSCGNSECVRLLLQHGADQSVQDDEGKTCTDVAYDETTQDLLYC